MPTQIGFNLIDALQRVLSISPERPAFHCRGETFTFSALGSRVGGLAASLTGLGVKRGDRMAVLSGNCHRFGELYWAAAAIGAAVVPLEARLTTEEMRFILGEAEPKALFADTPERIALLSELFPSASIMVSMSSGAAQGSLDYERLVVSGSGRLEPTGVDPDDPVAILYTAAVAGKPRGAVITHRNLVAQAAQTAERTGISNMDSHGVFLPLSHTFGAYLMFVASCNGAANTLLGAFDAGAAAELIGDGLVTFYAEFAPMGERIILAAEERGVPLGERLRFVTGLEMPSVIERYLSLGVKFWCMYGQTETAGLVAMGEALPGSVEANFSGVALSLSAISLRDQDGRPVPDGQAGEAWVRGDFVVSRYWPDVPTRLNSGWLQTGDVLRAESGQRLYFVARTGDKDLIKPGGLNVYPAEVEQVLGRHSGVEAAFVFGAPDPIWRERVCAVVIPCDDAPQSLESELRAMCEKALASFKRPTGIEIAWDLRGSSEPLSRVELRERYLAKLETS